MASSAFQNPTRRRFLAIVAGAATMAGCQPEVAPTDPCLDIRALSESDRRTRTATNYVAQTALPDQRCDTCQFWLPPASPSPCGGCVVVKGPIHPEGHCTSWAPVDNVTR